MQDLISVDGNYFNVSITEVKRTHNITDGDNAGRTAAPAADMIRDIIGTFMTYAISIEPKHNDYASYDSFIDYIVQPIDFVLLKVPYAQGWLTFNAYITKVEDSLKSNINGVRRWGGCSITFTAKSPQWRPS